MNIGEGASQVGSSLHKDEHFFKSLNSEVIYFVIVFICHLIFVITQQRRFLTNLVL
jgi:hypothetical protein